MRTSPYSGSFVVEKGASLAAAFRRMYATVVYVRVDLSNMMSITVDLSHGDSNNPPPSNASELVAGSGVQPEDLIITKRHWSAFGGTDLEAKLNGARVNTAVIAEFYMAQAGDLSIETRRRLRSPRIGPIFGQGQKALWRCRDSYYPAAAESRMFAISPGLST
jgi:hypothetical protein